MNVTSPPAVANLPMYPFRYRRSRHSTSSVTCPSSSSGMVAIHEFYANAAIFTCRFEVEDLASCWHCGPEPEAPPAPHHRSLFRNSSRQAPTKPFHEIIVELTSNLRQNNLCRIIYYEASCLNAQTVRQSRRREASQRPSGP